MFREKQNWGKRSGKYKPREVENVDHIVADLLMKHIQEYGPSTPFIQSGRSALV